MFIGIVLLISGKISGIIIPWKEEPLCSFSAYLPGESGRTKLIINVEGQKNPRPGYEIITRGIFYASRMISAQLGTEFSVPRYDDIKKVASIWICMDPKGRDGNTVSEYHICKNDLYGEFRDRPKAYDKLSVVMVTLDEKRNR